MSCFLIAGIVAKTTAQTSAVAPQMPWAESQLLAPAVLADLLKTGESNKPVIFNMGTVEDIKSAKHIGALSNELNAVKLKAALQGVAKNNTVVIYCGCCPFAKCPNIRPAFLALTRAGYTNVKVLNLPVNLKTNWINNGYPLAGN